MTRIVVDASVAVKWFLPEDFRRCAYVPHPDYELLAPDLLWAELGNVLWKKHRRGELDQRTATRLLGDFSRLPIDSIRLSAGPSSPRPGLPAWCDRL